MSQHDQALLGHPLACAVVRSTCEALRSSGLPPAAVVDVVEAGVSSWLEKGLDRADPPSVTILLDGEIATDVLGQDFLRGLPEAQARIGALPLDPRTGRPFGDHGTAAQAIDWALNHSEDGEIEAGTFLRCWGHGDTDEWPEFYVWLAAQDDGAA